MPCDPPWTAEEDRLLLSLACENGLETSCNETAKIMNKEAPKRGIYVRTYYASTIYFRMIQLLKPNYQFMTQPLKFNDAHKYNLSLKNDQMSPTEQSSDSSQASAGSSGADGQDQSTGKEDSPEDSTEDSPVPQLYGEPELYADLFPQLSREDEAGERAAELRGRSGSG